MDVPTQLNSILTGRYAIEREVGAGGMATVYLARDLKHRRRVALKVLRPELGAVPWTRPVSGRDQRDRQPAASASGAPFRIGRGGRVVVLCDAVYRGRYPARPVVNLDLTSA